MESEDEGLSIFDWLDGDSIILACEPRWTHEDEKSFLGYVASVKGFGEGAEGEAEAGRMKTTGKEYRQLLKAWAIETSREISVLGRRLV